MYMDKIKATEQSMERNRSFRNFGGPNAYQNFDASQYQYQYAVTEAQQQTLSRLNSNSSIVTLVLTNTDAETQTVTILNPGSGTTPDSTSMPSGTSITMKQGGGTGRQNYINMMNRVAQKPYLVWGLKIKVKDSGQFDNPIECGYTSGFGSGSYETLTLEAYGSMYQNETLKLDIPEFKFTVDSDSYMEVPVNGTDDGPEGGERVTLTFFLTMQLQPGRIFVGMDSLAVNPKPYISGLPVVEQTINMQQAPATNYLPQGQAQASPQGIVKQRMI